MRRWELKRLIREHRLTNEQMAQILADGGGAIVDDVSREFTAPTVSARVAGADFHDTAPRLQRPPWW